MEVSVKSPTLGLTATANTVYAVQGRACIPATKPD
jgi:hypothetical protein